MTFSDERYKIFRKEINVSLHREESIDAVHICNLRLLLLLFHWQANVICENFPTLQLYFCHPVSFEKGITYLQCLA
jgi:hypothetical protein